MRLTQAIHYLNQRIKPYGDDLWKYTHVEITDELEILRESRYIRHHRVVVRCTACSLKGTRATFNVKRYPCPECNTELTEFPNSEYNPNLTSQ